MAGSSDAERPLKEVKAALRKSTSARLKALDNDYIVQQGKLIIEKLLALEPVRSSHGVSVYLSMPQGEVPTYPILDQLFQASPPKSIFVPKVTGPRSEDMVMLPVASAQEIDSFPRSKWGIPEPELDPEKPDGTYSGKIDVVIVPGVAFDEGCNRLGHGKGYYDCFLARLKKSNAEHGAPAPFTVGLALGEQVVSSVPMDSFDLPLHAVVTPSQVFTRPAAAAEA